MIFNKINWAFRISLFLLITPEAIELIPAILPLNAKNKNAANPIKDPPAKADIGVKFIMFINLLIQEIQD